MTLWTRLSRLLTLRGRLSRAAFWAAGLALGGTFVVLLVFLETSLGRQASLALYPPFLWVALSLCTRRLHDRGMAAPWLLAALIPVVGPAWLAFHLALRHGTPGDNTYGPDPREVDRDYLKVADASTRSAAVVNDVTRLNPVTVWAIAVPRSVAEVQQAVRRSQGAISIGGGRFSMGGQTASPGSLHLDMRSLNAVLSFSPVQRTIRVQAGIRWCDIQRFVDPHDLAVTIMQTYANFTVGGSLSVNSHGRYVGLGPLVLSVRAIRIVLAGGEVVEATPGQHAEIFYGAIGGYGSLGVIVEADLDLSANSRVEQRQVKLRASDYAAWFGENVRGDDEAVFHNADLYAPHYTTCRAVTWVQTRKPVTVGTRLQPHRRAYPLETYFMWAITETPFGKWRREFLLDPVLYAKRRVHWRNFEAGYDVAELEPPSRRDTSYVLQEYFVPVERFDAFVPRMAEILRRHRVNALNVSVRHALGDPGTLLAWARGETFAFVLYYKQRTTSSARLQVGIWTRELIDAALSVGGCYYLPYQPHATLEQFHAAYPRAGELFAVKRKVDAAFRFRNALWDKYYAPTVAEPAVAAATPASDFHAVYDDTRWQDRFFLFLQNVYHLYPEDRFHALILEACGAHADDESIYRYVQARLPGIKPPLADLGYALPALFKQKREMTRQTLALLGDRRTIDGYVEIGTTGRYASALRRHVGFRGPFVVVNDVAPTSSPVDIAERGGLRKIGAFASLDGYAPLPSSIADSSVDLVTCYIGLHHIDPPRLAPFVSSIARVLTPGGLFVLRDHDVTTPAMRALVSLAHTVFNAGLNLPWEANRSEPRFFAPVADWTRRVEEAGFVADGRHVRQDHDPTDNLLMAFTKGPAR